MTALAINPPLRTIRLYGEAGSKFGRVHRMALSSNSVAEAVQALCSQIKGLRAYLMQAKDRGIGFAVFAGKKNLAEAELQHPVGDEDIRIAPIIMGSKNGGLLNVIVGAVLIIVGAIIDIYAPYLAPIGNALIGLGVSMAVGGIMQLLAPHPKLNKPGDSAANAASYAFNGPVNTQAQGNPVPYFAGGPMWIGSAVISAGITVEDHSHAALPPSSGSSSAGYGGDLYRPRTEVP